jgi:hypothetical protein
LIFTPTKNFDSGFFDNVKIPFLVAAYSSPMKQASQGMAYYISIAWAFGVT